MYCRVLLRWASHMPCSAVLRLHEPLLCQRLERIFRDLSLIFDSGNPSMSSAARFHAEPCNHHVIWSRLDPFRDNVNFMYRGQTHNARKKQFPCGVVWPPYFFVGRHIQKSLGNDFQDFASQQSTVWGVLSRVWETILGILPFKNRQSGGS